MQRGRRNFPVSPNPAFSTICNIISCKILELPKTQKTQPVNCCNTVGPCEDTAVWVGCVHLDTELGQMDCLGCLHPSLLSTAFSGVTLDRVCVWPSLNIQGGINYLNISNHYYFQCPKTSETATLSWQIQHRT